MTIVRKNCNALTPQEWTDLIDAINKMHGMGIPPPRYRDFVKVHVQAMDMSNPVGMTWHVHSMGPGMPGTNFLAWHRRFLLKFEARLRVVHANIALPYWDAITDRVMPAPMNKPALLASWGLTRSWDPTVLAAPADVTAAESMTTFSGFQSTIEGVVHGSVHNAVGGEMATASSPSDPLFWLHHANIDRLWGHWAAGHAGKGPTNPNEQLKPKPLFGVTVASVTDMHALGYQYA